MARAQSIRLHNEGRLDRSRLPRGEEEVAEYYRTQGTVLKGRGEWRDALCPFHGDTHPSLRVNVRTGAFRCMACGVNGRDCLAFHMTLHRMAFKDAARDLNAWEAHHVG